MMKEARQFNVIEADAQPIKCACCELPTAEVVGSSLILRVRHKGEKHTTALSLDFIKQLLERPNQEPQTTAAPLQ